MTETLYAFAMVAALWLLPVEGDVRAFLVNWKRAAGSGAILGCGVLVRPALAPSSLLFILVISYRVIREVGWRRIRANMVLGAAAFGLALSAVVVPWMLRNYTQFPSEYTTHLGQSHATLLGQWAPSPLYRYLFTPQFEAWRRSYEEPLVMRRPAEAPIVMRTVYPTEAADVERAFTQLKSENDHGDEAISERTLNAFSQIAAKRYAVSPQLHVTGPLSRMLRLWISPRISGLFRDHSGADSTRSLAVGLTLYDLLYVGPGFAGLFAGWKPRGVGWTFAVSMIAWHTALHSIWFPDTTSRYMVPLFPFLCIGFGATAQRLVTGPASRSSVPVDALRHRHPSIE